MKGLLAHGAYTDKVFFAAALLFLVSGAGLSSESCGMLARNRAPATGCRPIG
jgi:hypothetical protein